MTKTVETVLLNYSEISSNDEAWICHTSGGALTIWSSRIFQEGRFTCSFTTTLIQKDLKMSCALVIWLAIFPPLSASV